MVRSMWEMFSFMVWGLALHRDPPTRILESTGGRNLLAALYIEPTCDQARRSKSPGAADLHGPWCGIHICGTAGGCCCRKWRRQKRCVLNAYAQWASSSLSLKRLSILRERETRSSDDLGSSRELN